VSLKQPRSRAFVADTQFRKAGDEISVSATCSPVGLLGFRIANPNDAYAILHLTTDQGRAFARAILEQADLADQEAGIEVPTPSSSEECATVAEPAPFTTVEVLPYYSELPTGYTMGLVEYLKQFA
jgi:hypothetical protein